MFITSGEGAIGQTPLMLVILGVFQLSLQPNYYYEIQTFEALNHWLFRYSPPNGGKFSPFAPVMGQILSIAPPTCLVLSILLAEQWA